VVLHDVAPHTTVAGVPAVVVGVAAEENPAIEMNQRLDCCGMI
jgi:serine O-acetyltransferase